MVVAEVLAGQHVDNDKLDEEGVARGHDLRPRHELAVAVGLGFALPPHLAHVEAGGHRHGGCPVLLLLLLAVVCGAEVTAIAAEFGLVDSATGSSRLAFTENKSNIKHLVLCYCFFLVKYPSV